MSKSQFKEFTNIQNNYIDINNYYAPIPIEINDNIKESKNTNFNLLPNNSLNQNEIKKININDNLEFDISPQKQNTHQIRLKTVAYPHTKLTKNTINLVVF